MDTTVTKTFKVEEISWDGALELYATEMFHCYREVDEEIEIH